MPFTLSPFFKYFLRFDITIGKNKNQPFSRENNKNTKIYDNKRLLRVPNTINHKTGLYKVPIAYDKIKTINTYEELIKYASKTKPMVPRKYKYNEKARQAFDELIDRIDAEEKAKEKATELRKEAVEQQVEKMLHHTFGDFEPNERAAKLIADYITNNWWSNDKLKQAVAGQIVNRIKVTIESK